MAGALETIQDLLTRRDFLGASAYGMVVLLSFSLARALGVRSIRGWAILLSAAGVVGIGLLEYRRLSASLAIGVVGVAGWLLDKEQHSPSTRLGLSAWILMCLALIGFTWRVGVSQLGNLAGAIPVVALAVGWGLFKSRPPEDSLLLGPMIAISAFGIWTTVPNTDVARVFLGAALPISISTLRPIRSRITGAGAFALGATLAWVVSVGGVSRLSSIIGGWTCILAFAAWAAAAPTTPSRSRSPIVISLHILTVLVGARAIGLWQSTLASTAAAAVLLSAEVTILRRYGFVSSKITDSVA